MNPKVMKEQPVYNLVGDGMTIFGRKLRELHLQKGLKRSEATAKLNISNKALSACETGWTQPTMDVLKRTVEFLNGSVDYLLGLSEPSKAIVWPNLEFISACDGIYTRNAETYLQGNAVIDEVPLPMSSRREFATCAHGDSMKPKIRHEDPAIADPETRRTDDRIVAILEDHLSCLHVGVFEEQSSMIILYSTNSKCEPIVHPSVEMAAKVESLSCTGNIEAFRAEERSK
ncbi:MAG: LexA family transcriptional regulator [Pseudothermotoga sp.]|nr:LexA family transcriptional regulator [Pseudothermotoga sp.]